MNNIVCFIGCVANLLRAGIGERDDGVGHILFNQVLHFVPVFVTSLCAANARPMEIILLWVPS
jgi:hypothetical protein